MGDCSRLGHSLLLAYLHSISKSQSNWNMLFPKVKKGIFFFLEDLKYLRFFLVKVIACC